MLITSTLAPHPVSFSLFLSQIVFSIGLSLASCQTGLVLNLRHPLLLLFLHDLTVILNLGNLGNLFSLCEWSWHNVLKKSMQ